MVNSEKMVVPREGDVFKIPLGDGNAAVGLVVSSYLSSYYVVIFDFVAPETEVNSKVSDALRTEPVFGGLTLDALFRPGRWEVLENQAVDGSKYLPAYKTGTSELGNCMVEDFRAERRRAATESETQRIPFRKTTSPIVFERAMKAHLGLEPWLAAFDGVRLGEVITTAEVFGN